MQFQETEMNDAMDRVPQVIKDLALGIETLLTTGTSASLHFSLIVWPQSNDERCEYVSNCEREEVIHRLEIALRRMKESSK